MSTIYKLNNVSKKYGKIVALDDLTLDFNKGPIAVLGYSGAGKTTLLKLLAGLELASQGTIRFKKTNIVEKNIQNLRQVVTMLFQQPVFFNRSVLDNVAYGLKLRGVEIEEVTRRVEVTLASLGLEGFEKRKAMKLSGGEQQRVSLARALVLEPEILLLDEPTANLDPANARIIIKEIRKFAKRALVVVSTHNFLHVKELTKWAIYLEKGRLVEIGSTTDLFDNARDERTKRFISGLF